MQMNIPLIINIPTRIKVCKECSLCWGIESKSHTPFSNSQSPVRSSFQGFYIQQQKGRTMLQFLQSLQNQHKLFTRLFFHLSKEMLRDVKFPVQRRLCFLSTSSKEIVSPFIHSSHVLSNLRCSSSLISSSLFLS